MELLIFVLILFTIVFVIYLCGHITETLEEIKLARKDIVTLEDRLKTHNDILDSLLMRINHVLYANGINPNDLEGSVHDFEKEILSISGYEQYEPFHREGESECDIETHSVALDKETIQRCFEEEAKRNGIAELDQVTFAVIDDIAQDDAEAQRDCIDECDPEKCPVEDCKHKEAFKWSLLS